MANITAHPVNYDASKCLQPTSAYPLSNVIGKGSNATTFGTAGLITGASAETFLYFGFDLSQIPSNADISSVKCNVKTNHSNSSVTIVTNWGCYLSHNKQTVKSNVADVTSAVKVVEIIGTGWSRAELNDCYLTFYGKRGTTAPTYGSSYNIYGADLEIEYSEGGSKFMLKVNGAWKNASKLYKKVDGIWVEIDAEDFDQEGKYIIK